MKELIENHIIDGSIRKAISIFLKWEIIDSNTRKELTLHLSRYNRTNYDFKKGLIRKEDYTITRNKITELVLELLYEIERKYIGKPLKYLPNSILVAGTGTKNLSEKEIICSKALGRFLGSRNYILVTSGWKGVDYYTATEFYNTIGIRNERQLYKRLFQIISKTKEPMFEKGNVFFVKEGDDEWTRSLNLADFVILIGGMGGTYSTYKIALREGIPVFPIFDTEGDTTTIANELQLFWPSNVYKNIDKNEFFTALSREINDDNDVIEICSSIEIMIDKLNG